MKKILNEGLNYMDMEGQMYPVVGIDQYASSVGQDDDMITLDFAVKNKQAATDLAEWFERGYTWVIDAEPSPGEVSERKFLVFVEMTRRSRSPEQIMEMLEDLETLTGFKKSDWKIKIGEETKPATAENIKAGIELSPHDYRVAKEEPLNEWREIAGIPTVSTYENDEAIRAIKRQAGIY